MSAAAFDLVIRRARVATASDTFNADIGVKDGRIAQLGAALGAGDNWSMANIKHWR